MCKLQPSVLRGYRHLNSRLVNKCPLQRSYMEVVGYVGGIRFGPCTPACVNFGKLKEGLLGNLMNWQLAWALSMLLFVQNAAAQKKNSDFDRIGQRNINRDRAAMSVKDELRAGDQARA